jgi:hypothetical protein
MNEFINWILNKVQRESQEEWTPEPLHLEENIRPEDLPPNDGPFPKPLPNKRVIIIDI